MVFTDDKSGHRSRLRDKFLRSGFDGFHDYEVIELLLTLGSPRKDCKPQAKALIKRFGTVRGVLAAGTDELTQVPGVGDKNVFGLRLGRELAERFLRERTLDKRVFRTARDLFDYLNVAMRDQKHESFRVLFLDSRNRMLGEEELFRGTVNAAAVYPREVVKRALAMDATGIVCAHNHPTGQVDPSAQDRAVTELLLKALGPMRMTLVDHLIIGDNRYYSFAQSGVLAACRVAAGV